jgi:nicotinate-nucleotide--dimethylbenzimidazole phosphoribosyltransferase
VTHHRARVPPRPLGERAAEWLAGRGGGVRRREVVPGPEVDDLPPLSTPRVAELVDRGRELAAAAAADEIVVLVGSDGGQADGPAAARLTGWLDGTDPDPEISGPLGALRRLGTGRTALLCGLALGAGEQGLAYVAEGPEAAAGARVAMALEPGLRGRVRI